MNIFFRMDILYLGFCVIVAAAASTTTSKLQEMLVILKMMRFTMMNIIIKL